MAAQHYYKALALLGLVVLLYFWVSNLHFSKPSNTVIHSEPLSEEASPSPHIAPSSAPSTTSPPPPPLPPVPPVTSDMMLSHNSPKCAFGPSEGFQVPPSQGHICIVVRSYLGHITDKEYPLSTFLHCFQQMEYQDWSMYIFNSDTTPALGLLAVIANQSESIRNKIHWVEVPPSEVPKYGCWPGDCGYTPTDWVIWNACPRDSRWLHVTNGDNEYHPQFFNFLLPQVDLIGFDFFLHTLVYAIDNHVVHPDLMTDCLEEYRKTCLQTTMKVSGTDLASVIYNFERFIKEERTFRTLGHTAHDGVMVEAISKTWPTMVVRNCYMSHNPNIWSKCRHNSTTHMADPK